MKPSRLVAITVTVFAWCKNSCFLIYILFESLFAKLIKEDFSFFNISCQTHFLKHYLVLGLIVEH